MANVPVFFKKNKQPRWFGGSLGIYTHIRMYMRAPFMKKKANQFFFKKTKGMIQEIREWVDSIQTESEEPVKFTKIVALRDEISDMGSYVRKEVFVMLKTASMQKGLCLTLLECCPVAVPVSGAMGLKLTVEATRYKIMDPLLEFVALTIKRQLTGKSLEYDREYAMGILLNDSLDWKSLLAEDGIAAQKVQKLINDDKTSRWYQDFKIVSMGHFPDEPSLKSAPTESDAASAPDQVNNNDAAFREAASIIFKDIKQILVAFVLEKKIKFP